MMYLVVLLGLLPTAVRAATIERIGAGSPGINQMWADIKSMLPHTNIGGNGLTFLTLKFTSIFLRMIGGIAVAVIIYAGLRMVMARGNDEGFTEAKKILTYTIFGLIFAITADSIINYALTVITAATR